MVQYMKEIINLLREILYEVRHINEIMTEDREKENVILIKNTTISNNQRIQK